MFCYTAYGLDIRSSLHFTELESGSGGADVAIRLDRVPHRPAEDTTAGCWQATANEAYFFWKQVGAIAVRAGSEIIFDPAPGVDEGTLRLLILGPALGLLLLQRSHLVLHASAAAVNGSAVVFLGDAGWGKSTTAAAMFARGHGVIADDVTAVRMEKDDITVMPAFPQLKLLPDAAAALGYAPEGMSCLSTIWDNKRGLPVASGFLCRPFLLDRVYVLAQEAPRPIEPLSGQEAFVELVCHSYGGRWLQAMEAAALHFRQCVKLVDSVPVYRLQAGPSVAEIFRLVRLVEDNLAEFPSP